MPPDTQGKDRSAAFGPMHEFPEASLPEHQTGKQNPAKNGKPDQKFIFDQKGSALCPGQNQLIRRFVFRKGNRKPEGIALFRKILLNGIIPPGLRTVSPPPFLFVEKVIGKNAQNKNDNSQEQKSRSFPPLKTSSSHCAPSLFLSFGRPLYYIWKKEWCKQKPVCFPYHHERTGLSPLRILLRIHPIKKPQNAGTIQPNPSPKPGRIRSAK